MAKKMLIDATHAEETRVVVVDGNRVDDFDFESAFRRQLAGNIYLAKVTRVEPSLQAAFIDYGGNRHGFLAFAEIHPDYYQIPIADRQALLAEERALAESQREDEGGEGEAAEDGDEERGGERRRNGRRSRGRSRSFGRSGDAVATREPGSEPAGMETIDLGEGDQESPEPDDLNEDQDSMAVVEPEGGAAEGLSPMATVHDTPVETPAAEDASEAEDEAYGQGQASDAGPVEVVEKDETIETVAEEEDVLDLRPVRRPSRARRYKIQEVVKVRQIMLVQVVKEERGNKGAALTTYLSLAGRYCVLMPNTARGGGISRKITNAVDRKKLKEIAAEMDVPDGAGLIIRTAGSQRTKAEIKRDYEYLQRLWEQIRELTLRSIAPAKIYEEGDLIKRTIRDLYSKDIEEVVVEGAEGFRSARDFMKMMMPSHARSVVPYSEPLPLFARYQVESFLASMFNPVVQLPSGGYIVIGVTEALVAIDVNSGRATKEGSIEQTALKTNLEAAEEVARQLRLRDLAGLIVIDFIDMDERKNNAAVEKRFKDRLKTDRARIQVGRISGFGLLEMSRQRLRPGMLEATTQPCSHCHGTGLLRSDDSVALAIIRQLDEEGVRARSREVLLRAPVGIVNYLMNHKREHVAGIEQRYGMAVRIEADTRLVSPDFSIEKFRTATRAIPEPTAFVKAGGESLMVDEDEDLSEDLLDEEVVGEDEADQVADAAPEAASIAAPEGGADAEEDDRPRKKRRRRRRRRGADRGETAAGESAWAEVDEDSSDESMDASEDASEDLEEEAAVVTEAAPAEVSPEESAASEVAAEPASDATPTEAAPEEPAPARKRSRVRTRESAPADEVGTGQEPRRRTRARRPGSDEAAQVPEGMNVASEGEPEPAKPARGRRTRATRQTDEAAEPAEASVQPVPAPSLNAEASPDVEPAAETVSEPPVGSTSEPQRDDREPVAAGDEDEGPKPKRRGWWSLGRS